MSDRGSLAILSAVLLILSFPNFNVSYFAWVAFIPLLFAIENKDPREAFRTAYLTGTVFFLGTVYWLVHVTLPGMVLVVLYLGLYFGAFGFILSRAKAITGYRLLFFIPALWVALEWLRSHLLGGFGWALLAHSQSKALAIIQISDMTGAYGTSFLVMLVNTALYMTIKSLRERKTQKLPYLVVAVAILYLSVTYGIVRIKNIFTGEALKVAIVQGNIPQDKKWDPGFKSGILDKYDRLTGQANKEKPDLIVWPETSVPGFLGYEKDVSERMKTLAVSTGTHLLVGAPSAEGDWDRIYNSAVLLSGEGRVVDRYDKIHLVPFGEYVPFKKVFSFVEKFAKSPIGDFSAGKKYTVFKFFIERRSEGSGASWKLLKKAKFSSLICFEDIFPDLTRKFIKEGAVFLVNITNDAWFGNTSAPYQHAQCSVFRAVENRVNVIRVANTGLSCFIDQKGRVTDTVSSDGRELFVEGFKTKDIILTPTRTFYTVYGDIFAYGCILYVIFCLVSFLYPQRFRSRLR